MKNGFKIAIFYIVLIGIMGCGKTSLGKELAKLLSMTEDQFLEYISKFWLMLIWGNKKYVVEQMIEYFEDHYAEKISLDQIAENMYLSPFYISKIFKSETGASPSDI